jgi:hypothetical protein
MLNLNEEQVEIIKSQLEVLSDAVNGDRKAEKAHDKIWDIIHLSKTSE